MKKVYFAQINNIITAAVFLPLSVACVWEYCRLQPDISEVWITYFLKEKQLQSI
jgi:hypothetical protein